MKIRHSVVFVGFGYAMRLGAGIAVIVALARTIGVQEFGYFAFWLTISTLASIPVNFGFPTMVLREFGVAPKQAGALLSEVLSAKILLSLAVLLCALASSLWLSTNDFSIFLLLLAAQVCDSFAEFFNLGFRRYEKFLNETQTAMATSAIHILVVIAVVLVYQSAFAAAVSFLASRATALLAVIWATKWVFQDVRPSGLKAAWLRIKSTWAFALEVALLTGNSQTDTLVINHFLGHASLGIYQAGMKLVEGACRIAPVLAQLLIPRLAAASSQGAKFKAEAWRSIAAFGAVGAAGGAVLYLGAPWIVQYLFGKSFAALEPLMPLFGVMLLFRYLETATGLLLVAYGLQHRKVWLVLGQFLFVIAFGIYAVQSWGLVGWQTASIVGLALVTCAYLLLLKTGIDRFPPQALPVPISDFGRL